MKQSDSPESAPAANPGERDGAASAVGQRNLDQALVRGLAWTAAAKWLGQILTWTSTLIVARLLAPEDYGLFAMATVFIGLIELLNEFGMGAAIVRHRDLSERQITQINGLCVLVGVAGCVVTIAAAWPLARFYDAPALVPVLAVLSLNFIITSFRTVPLALMQRDLHFRAAAFNDAIQAIALSVGAVVFAVSGFQYWTLVLSALLSGTLSTLLAVRRCPRSLAWPRRRDIGEAITFGGHIVGWRIGWYVCSKSDFIVAGRMLGERALGVYSMAMIIASIPSEKITALMMRVVPSIFSAVQNDLQALRRYVVNITEALAVITTPAAIGIALIAPDFVPLVLGEQWREAVVPMQILAIEAAYGALVPLIASVGTVIGLSGQGMRNAMLKALIMPPAFLVGSQWGITGIALTWIIVNPLISIPFYAVIFRRMGLQAGEYFRALWPALSAALVMAAVFLVIQSVIDPHWPQAPALLIKILAAALTYAAVLWLFHGQRLRAVREVARSLRST